MWRFGDDDTTLEALNQQIKQIENSGFSDNTIGGGTTIEQLRKKVEEQRANAGTSQALRISDDKELIDLSKDIDFFKKSFEIITDLRKNQ